MLNVDLSIHIYTLQISSTMISINISFIVVVQCALSTDIILIWETGRRALFELEDKYTR